MSYNINARYVLQTKINRGVGKNGRERTKKQEMLLLR